MTRKIFLVVVLFSTIWMVHGAKAESAVQIDPLIIQKLEKQVEFRVIITLKDQGSITCSKNIPKEERRGIFQRRKNYFREKEKEFLSVIPESYFRPVHLFALKNAIYGSITKEGLNKLKKNPLIEKIEGDRIVYITLQQSVPIINADDVWQTIRIGVDKLVGAYIVVTSSRIWPRFSIYVIRRSARTMVYARRS